MDDMNEFVVKVMTRSINDICDEGSFQKTFCKSIFSSLPKNPGAKKCELCMYNWTHEPCKQSDSKEG